jgi:hypothetical protein
MSHAPVSTPPAELELTEQSQEIVLDQLERSSMLHPTKGEAKTAELPLALAHVAQCARRQ